MQTSKTVDLTGIEFRGRPLEVAEVEFLQSRLPDLMSPWLSLLLRNVPLTGSELAIDDSVDLSGLGVDLRWMTPDEIVSEATEAQPGVAARPLGLLPIGICLQGSGDPYFIRPAESDDPALLRVPHDAVHDGQLDSGAIDLVSPAISEFLRAAKHR